MLLQRFTDYIAKQHLLSKGEKVLLAVSGGRDSVAMLSLAQRAGCRYAVAHCNFHLRGADADRDQAFVASLAADDGVDFHTVDFDTVSEARHAGESVEEAARRLRYQWFAHLCTLHGYAAVATAHHADDSVETFFLNLFRGTGLLGLHGIRPLSELYFPDSAVKVIRPMLCFSRAEIDSYVAQHALAYVDDNTNFQLDARRNQLRLRLMPLLRELYPSVDVTMLANIDRLADAGALYRQRIEELRKELVHPYVPLVPTAPCTAVSIACDRLLSVNPLSTVAFELLKPYGFNAAAVGEITASVHAGSTGIRFLSATHEASIARGLLIVAPIAEPVEPRFERSTFEVGRLPIRTSKNEIIVDADKLQEPLSLRPWRDGDRFVPFGMKGSRLVSDFLKDLKLSFFEKRNVWLLVDASDRVVWVVGLRAADCFGVGEGTCRAERIALI